MRGATGSLLGGVLLLSACAAVEPYQKPALTAPTDFAAPNRPSPGMNELWWLGFSEPQLNALVEQALLVNRDIEAARQRLLAARASLRAERSDRRPSVDGYAEGGAEVEAGGSGGLTGVAGLSVLLDPDLSGRLSYEVQVAAAQAAAADYFVADTRRIVAAAVVDAFIELRRTQARLALLEESTALQQQTLEIVSLRFEAGLSANLDVRRAAADLARTRAQRGLLEISRAQAANSLAILLNRPPRNTLANVEVQPEVPDYRGGPPIGLPADLLRRRPDLLVAEADLLAAAAQVGAERADLRPRLTIPGSLVLGSGTLGGLVDEFLGTLVAALDVPIFDGGRRRAEIAAARAETDARYAEYRRSLLSALADVEGALVAADAYEDRIADLEQAINESQTAFDQSNALYREGLATLFDVLDAQRQLISSREALIDAEANLASAIVSLYASLGAPTTTPVAEAAGPPGITERDAADGDG
ncbi:efflux transporter outer membrane subunit [Pacificimonas flava]|nr:efflux transporter outer membrane subunit [Pacificimonas flava]